MKKTVAINYRLKMNFLLIFVVLNIAVCSKAERRQKRRSVIDSILFFRICRSFTEEMTMHRQCRDCAAQAVTLSETEKNSEDDLNEMSNSNIQKTKAIVTKCSNYMTESDQLVACTKLDDAELISCLKRVFPVGRKMELASFLCHSSDDADECRQCLLDSGRKAWKNNNKKTEKRDTSDSKEADEINELQENEATEIANNCNHVFKVKNMIKKCANQEFGKRMECIHKAVYFHFNHDSNLVFQLCSYSKEPSMEKDCDNCVIEAIHTEDNVDYDDELQKKENCKKALEKCGQYIERQEEMVECTNMDAEDMEFCFLDVVDKITNKKLAIKMCKNTAKSDECVECVYSSLQNASEEFYNSSSEENEEYHLDRLEFTKISKNCNQHFQKEEELKECSKVQGGMMDCMKEVLSIDKE